MEQILIETGLESGLQLLFYALVILFLLHALALAYHWANFGDSKSMTVIALAIYLAGGAILFLAFSFSLFNL